MQQTEVNEAMKHGILNEINAVGVGYKPESTTVFQVTYNLL